MAGYSLPSSYPTVQVVSPQLVYDIQYCTIQTQPSGVIASIPVVATTFANDQGAAELTNFSEAIEELMALPSVIAGVGSQKIELSGLLADYVDFTVQYPATNPGNTSVTGVASVPVGLLNFSDAEIGRVAKDEAEAIINQVYASLRSLAGG